MYKPLLIKEAILEGVFDEDLYQELIAVLIRCIRTLYILNLCRYYSNFIQCLFSRCYMK